MLLCSVHLQPEQQLPLMLHDIVDTVGTVDTADIVHTVDTLDNVKSVNSVDNVSSVNSVTPIPTFQIWLQMQKLIFMKNSKI